MSFGTKKVVFFVLPVFRFKRECEFSFGMRRHKNGAINKLSRRDAPQFKTLKQVLIQKNDGGSKIIEIF